ncbi:MAG: 2-oxo acid dehydrogenase subunit E2, partial [Alphaproteobacteria bacterium]
TPADVPVVVHFVRALAEYEKLLHEAKGTEADFAAALFGATPRAAAIINPPQSGILAVSAGEQRPVVKNGALAIATVMTLTLSVDHRVIDGALAAEFLQALKRNIEDPLSLML